MNRNRTVLVPTGLELLFRFEGRDVSVTPEKGFVSSDVARKAVDDLNLKDPPFTWIKSAKDGPPEKS